MDSHSRSASPREPMRPQHRPPSPPSSPSSPGAFDNRAYTHDEDPNHNDSFTSNGPQQNGHSKEPNGDTKLPEAVNLELINLTPKNGTKKKDVEVDMNASNPYDEYFVPVNEHRKFMRGEKLYVTADKRGEKAGCKRPLCWTLLVLVVAAIIAIIVLAATGILFSSAPTTLEQYNTSVSSARAFGGIGGHSHHNHDHDHDDHDHDHSHDHDHGYQDVTTTVTPEHGPEQNDEPSSVVADDDMSLYVPRTLEGELTIDNEEFSPALEDPESAEYREFVATFTDGLKKALFDRNTLENGNNDVIVEVVKLRKGSVVVTYRIHWKPKLNAEPTPNLLTAESLKTNLDGYLATNNRMINVYHVYEDKTPTKPVLDICQIDNNQCEHGCEFDETSLEFTCTCPYGQILDMTNPKKCVAILENTYPLTPTENTEDKQVKVLQTDSNPITTKPVPEEEKPVTELHVNENDNVFDWKEPHHTLPETTTQSDADLNMSHIFGHGNEHDTEAPRSVEASPEPTSEPKAEPEPAAEPKPEPEPEPTAEPNIEVLAEPKSEPEPTTEPKAEPEPSAEPNVEPEITFEHKIEPEFEPQTTVEPKAEPEPTVEPEPTAEPKAEPEPTAEPKVEPEPAAEPKPESEPTAEPKFEHEHPTAKPEPNANPEIVMEPKTESDESIVETKPEIELTLEPQPTAEPASQHESDAGSATETELSEIESSSKTPTSEAPAEHVSPDQDVLGLEVIHIIPSMTTESVPLPTYAPITTSELSNTHSVNIHEIIEKANNQGSRNTLEVTRNEPALAVIKDNSESRTESDTDAKPADVTENATLRVSISEPHIINEPSYEPKPEIISMFSEKNEGESMPKFVTEDNNEPTTDHSEWLQGNLDMDTKKSNELQNNSMHNEHNDSEQRSFKSIDILAEDTTTEKTGEHDLSSSVMVEKNVDSEIIKQDNEEHTTLTNQSDHLESATTETMPHIIAVPKYLNQTSVTSEVIKDNNTDLNAPEEGTDNEKPQVSTAIHEGRSLNSNEVPAIIPTTDSLKEYSINESFNSSDAEKDLINALVNKNINISDTTTKKFVSDDGMDITFDNINMLYNRSAHSINIQNESNPDVTEAIMETTTVSDWLSEPFTEINFEEAMNKMDKHESTESSNTKIDEIINNGVTKDDFEPDYLNNMSSNNNKMKEDIPLYGITHDYDSEDPRVKRVNEEKEISKEASTKKMTNEAAVTESNLALMPINNVTESKPDSSDPIETTTIIEYIYKTAEKVLDDSSMNPAPQRNLETISFATTTSTEKFEPAPVWEDSEADKEMSVKLLEKPVNGEPISATTHVVLSDEVKVAATVIPTIIAATTTDAAPALTTVNNMQDMSAIDSDVESQTKVNNLNVTIYEISSHNRNNSFAVTNQHPAEFEDHETEMNPFLPEVENNKSLVKKLQEGHDIEPTTFNETQNENVEDRSNNTSETARVINNDGSGIEMKATSTATPVTSEAFATFNELMKSNVPDTDKDKVIPEKIDTENSEEKKPISTFLLDTDDLDKKLTTEHKTTVAENILENGNITPSPLSPIDLNDDSDYLSVVPIEEERLEEKESLKKDYGSELNDISDSPKKSDRRTLDETKFDSVNDNEA